MLGSAGAAVRLEDGEVHVWLFDLDRHPERFERPARALEPGEWEQGRRFCFDRDRRRFVARRAARRALLARYTGLDPAGLRFALGPRGKPELVSGEISFSSSHACGLGLLAVARSRRVGADLERVREVRHDDAIAGTLFAAEEAAALATLPTVARLEAFFDRWTRKEAYLKATGDGLDEAGLGRTVGGGEPDETGRCSLQTLRPAAGWVAAVAAEGRGWRLSCRWW
jgi:4'-phosphopantetheinyl transferase